MSDPATLTPPADAPLPYRVSIGMEPRIYDATDKCFAVGVSILDIPALAYLVSAANAAPGLVAERDDLKARFLTATSDAVWAAHQRDTALARVAKLVAERDRLREERDHYREKQPGLVAERDWLRAESLRRGTKIESLESDRDTALARVAELEDVLRSIAAESCDVDDAPLPPCSDFAVSRRCASCRATATLDKDTP